MENNLIAKIKANVESVYSETTEHYRHLHQYPELSFNEKKTSEYIESILESLKIEYKNKIGGYGILAWIKGLDPTSRSIALRADMDALPIEEKNDISYKSKNEGIMHACGHDSHTASLLSVAKIINNNKDKIKGTVLFIFQPGEEKHPGGARLMLEDGVFNEIKPEIIIGQHASIDYPIGSVGFESGVIMASADEIHIKITGKGGHGAIPNQLNDTVLASAQVVISMQQAVSRRSNPFIPMVLSFGKFIADGATNIIPNEVILAGTLRCMDENERNYIKPIIRDIAIHTAKAYGCECTIDIYDGYPCTINDNNVTDLMKRFAVEYLGKENVSGLPKKMTSEDFSFFSQKYPSTFYRFGVQGQQKSSGLHTPYFIIDEESLKTSVGVMAYLALKYCS